jgi:hypothetical protein
VEFSPRVPDPDQWRLQKLNASVSPYDVVSNGGRSLHAVQALTHPCCRIDLLDSALVSPERSHLWTFTNEPAIPTNTWLCNLHNNQWGTNFPMWFGEPLQAEFVLKL